MKKLLAIILVLCTLCLSSCFLIEVPHSHITDIVEYGKYDNCIGEHETKFFSRIK